MRAQDFPAPHDHSRQPRDAAEGVTTAPAGSAPPSEETDQLRVLVVDDESTLRGVIAQVLRLDGHDATEANSAETALAAFRARPFPIVITDVIMGGMSGLELLREIKAIDSETQVVIMTSQASL